MSDDIEFLLKIRDTIKRRRVESPEDSYTASLFKDGLRKISQKVGEEAVEVVIAALTEDDKRLKSEMADLIFHIFVLLEAKDISFEDIVAELKLRDKTFTH
jgi:phosphoribosyl-AMP cyclohydrolase / phosphoribosyl-ATP pyrophosphohydrolase